MKLFRGLGLLFFASLAVAQNASAEAETAKLQHALQLFASMPTCGQHCLTNAINASPCTFTDLSCSCSNSTITNQVSACVLESCSIRNALTAKNVSNTLCSLPVRDHSSVVVYTGIVGLAVAIIAFILRIISRSVGEGTFQQNAGLDDVVMLVALLPVTGISACSVLLANHGFGKDIWTVPFESITLVLKTYYFDEILYIITLPLIKISVLLTYLRIFLDKRFRILCYVLIGLCVAYVIAFLVVTVVQCTPIPYVWLKWDGEHQGKCMHVNAQIFSAAALNILADLIIVAMPMPLLWNMNMNVRNRLLVMLMFSTGIFVTIVSVLRLQYLVQFAESTNATWDYTRVGYWSTIEMHTSVLCACMPAIRRLIKNLWPKLIGTMAVSKSSTIDRYPDATTEPISKFRPVISVRSKGSSDGTFIPLHDLDQERGYEASMHSTAQLNQTEKDVFGRVSPL